jgi:hypothetical protein
MKLGEELFSTGEPYALISDWIKKNLKSGFDNFEKYTLLNERISEQTIDAAYLSKLDNRIQTQIDKCFADVFGSSLSPPTHAGDDEEERKQSRKGNTGVGGLLIILVAMFLIFSHFVPCLLSLIILGSGFYSGGGFRCSPRVVSDQCIF